ncbi:snRNA-activating protein complex subunit 4 [Helicoverpa armigera]|uniref:snRNA-activating protein complex subunit 4 n=1 Tax=Helicoverpa armigera TaxID=29058 RepID=UPI00308386C3
MEFNDIEMDVDTDSEFDSDEDVLLEAENMKRLNALLEEEDDALSQSMSQRLPALPSIHPALTIRPCSSKHSLNDTKSKALAQIDVALSANKILDEKMRRLERDLGLRLRECRERLQVIQSSSGGQGEKNESFRYINCGRPYFKDKLNFPAPDNDDAKMAKSQMYDFSLVVSVPGWTVRDKSQFINMIQKMSVDIRKNALHKKITNLKRCKSISKSKLENDIQAIRNEIDQTKSLPLSQIALPIDQEYDWDMLANKLNRRHTAQEYQSLWKLFFHPSINKNSWSKSEHAALQKIACQNRQQDWDTIARKLNTGRTGYQCFVYYRTNMMNSFTGKKWTNEEITYLKRLIDYFKEDMYIPWGKIAAAMENRTKIQIYNKYLRIIEQRKGRFLPEEDAVILNCVERFGTDFKRMADYLPGRSMVQIRTRYQVLSKMRVSTVWTVEDDKKLIQIMTNQAANMMNFSTATQYFPGRNRTNLRTRYITLMKWMKKHPTLDLEHAPRRGARRLNHGFASDNLNEAIENLKNTLNTEVEIKSKKKRITVDSPGLELNNAITVVIINELVKEKEDEMKIKYAPENYIYLGPDHVITVADLNITNLRKNLIFLNASLDQAAYNKSQYKTMYPDIGNSEQDVSLVKVKSYSRKNSVKTIKVDETPNVWGRPRLNTFRQRNYVLPPHLCTITGCSALIQHVTNMGTYCDSFNLQVLVRRNSDLKELLDLVLERFYTLFTWPMILSNEWPHDNYKPRFKRTDSVFVRPPKLPCAPAVTINMKCMKKYKNVDSAEVIDLNEEQSNNIKVTVPEKLVRSDEKIEKLLSSDE